MRRAGHAGRIAAALAACLVLPACMGGGAGVGMGAASRPADPALTALAGGGSALIADLSTRPGIIPPGTPYAQIAAGVAETGRGAAAAELRMARLAAQARSRNWLPSIGPSVDLTSLGALAASLLAEAVLFDNGRKQAERDFAAADVEVAAVTLAEEANDRLHDALAHHVAAEQARAQGAVADRAVAQLAEVARVLAVRSAGGLSDRSEVRAVEAKLAEARSIARSDAAALADAQAALAALAGPVAASGLADLPPPPAGTVPLAVLRAEAEGLRMLAQARIERAGHLPGLGVRATLGSDGVDAGLRLGADKMLNAGTGNSLRALEAAQGVATDRVAEARGEATRNRAALERRIAALEADRAEGAALVAQGAEGLRLIAAQQKAGRRTLMDLASAIEAQAALERVQAGLPHRIAALRLQIARDAGVLAAGPGP